jgi:hypothetical protein
MLNVFINYKTVQKNLQILDKLLKSIKKQFSIANLPHPQVLELTQSQTHLICQQK